MNDQFKPEPNELDARARRVHLAHQRDFAVGPINVRPSLRSIAGPSSEMMLEPKVMQVLVALAHPIGAILSRDDLIERCWDGRIVGDTSINRVISLLRSGLKQVAGDAVTIANVPKVGYRIVISEATIGPGAAASKTPQQKYASDKAPAASRRFLLIAAGLAAVLALITAVLWSQQPAQGPVERLRVAMLPLEYADDMDPLYVKGLEAELRSQFARVGAMEVTASESAVLLSEKGLEESEIGRRLNVDYIWSGGILSQADNIELSARLVRVSDGQVAWEDQLLSAPDAAQYLPLRTAREVATALGRPASERISQTPVSASSYRLYLTALGLIKGRGVEQRVAAVEIMEQVTAQSPAFADGWAGLAKARYLNPNPDTSFEGGNWGEAKRLAEYALTLDPKSVDALKVAGSLDNDPKQRLEMLRKATQLDPGDAEAWFWLSIAERKSMLLDVDPLASATQMVAIDPLWPAVWRASDTAAEFGQLETARKIEQDILSAAVTPSQRYLAEGRLARLEGDFSRFFELSVRSAPTETPAERRYGSAVVMRMMRKILRLPFDEKLLAVVGPERSFTLRLKRDDLPSLAEFDAAGFGRSDGREPGFWETRYIAQYSLPMFLRQGREDDLLKLYDARFSDHAEFLEYAEMTGMKEMMIPQASSILGAALQNAGREGEAAAHFASAEEQIALWRAKETKWILPLLFEIDVAAAKGENDRAIALIRQLPAYNWPWIMGHIDATSIGLLGDSALHDDLRKLPEVRAVLDPIEAKIAQERAEILALGL
ncbi:winged helix-turn-helix domain-containing protein [Erythrobacter sp. MTPC3]|uniref:winged helix-turn-helix domain-containing protein n=1 Tax=Erythrobacter sp. MTPC3 TaxID=3056564 RepID=UPI0036F26FA9